MSHEKPLRFAAVFLLVCLLLVACNKSEEPAATTQPAPQQDAGATGGEPVSPPEPEVTSDGSDAPAGHPPPAADPTATAAYAFPELTGREREILEMLARHATNQEIARVLHLSPKTVRNYTSNIFAKLQVADRAEAIIRARDAGLGRSD